MNSTPLCNWMSLRQRCALDWNITEIGLTKSAMVWLTYPAALTIQLVHRSLSANSTVVRSVTFNYEKNTRQQNSFLTA